LADRRLVFDRGFVEQLTYWAKVDQRKAVRILELVEDIRSDPFRSTGRPELLKHLGPNQWSRRIDQEHRSTYRVFDDRIEFVTCRYHYGK
jgi:toxin YoeB